MSALVNGSSGAATTGVSTLVQSGTIAAGAGGNNTAPLLTQPLHFAINNTNTGGVAGGTDAADPVAAAAVSTGIELSVALADIGNPTVGSVIKIAAMYGNGDHNFLSNQLLGGLPVGTGNLGGNGGGTFTGNLGGVDLRQFPGNQWFSVRVVPEPSSLLGYLSLMALAAVRARRRHA